MAYAYNLKVVSRMKALKYGMALVLLVFLFGNTDCNASSESGTHPEQVELLANGWMLAIKPDGSAGIARHKESNDSLSAASTAPGAVDFEKVKRALEANLGRSGSTKAETRLQAAIRMKGQVGVVLKPVSDVEIWNRLIVQLEPKWTGPTLSFFKKAVEKNSLKIASP